MKKSLILMLILLTQNTTIFAQDGALDLSFNGVGTKTIPIGNGFDISYALDVQSDGKIIAVGSSNNGSFNDIGVVRLNPDGTLDGSFDSDGKATYSIGSNDAIANGCVVQSDDKTIVAGYSNNGIDDDFILIRLNNDGSLDNTFGTAGITITNIGDSDKILGVALQSDGKIVVAGYATMLGVEEVAIARYNSDGSIDNTFANNGIFQMGIGVINDRLTSLAIQPDGKIVAAGFTENTFDESLVIRLTNNGALDNTFNSTGIKQFNAGIGNSRVYGVKVTALGKIVLGGYATSNTSVDFAISQLNNDGSFDNSFNMVGTLTLTFGSASTTDYIRGIAIENNGNIIAAGVTNASGNDNIAVAKIKPDGTLDTEFNSNGLKMIDIENTNDYANAVVLQTDGKIVIAGDLFLSAGGVDFALARLQNSAIPSAIDNLINLQSIKVYPSPTSSIINIEGGQNFKNYMIYNSEGAEIERYPLNGQSAINITLLPNGIYYLVLNNTSNKEVLKFVKQ